MPPPLNNRISEHERIIAFRNHLIHGYSLFDNELVWDTIRNELPALLGGRRVDTGTVCVSPKPARVVIYVQVSREDGSSDLYL